MAHEPLWRWALRQLHHDRIYVAARGVAGRSLFRENPLQALVVHALLRGHGFGASSRRGTLLAERAYPGRVLRFLAGRGEEPAELEYPGSDYLPAEELSARAPDRPLIVFENRLFSELAAPDQRKAILQLSLSLSTLRRWLWDGNMVMLNSPEALARKFAEVNAGAKVRFLSSGEFLDLLRSGDRAVVLDPMGPEVLSEEELRRSSVVIIGGIVDRAKSMRGATKRIAEELSREVGVELDRYRIELDGITAAVPHRLHAILEVVLRVMLGGEGLRRAVMLSMSNRDAAWYLGMLVARRCSIDLLAARIRELEEVRGRPLSREVLEHAARIAGCGASCRQLLVEAQARRATAEA